MSEQDNIKASQAFLEAWNSGNLRMSIPYQSDDFRQDAPGASAPMTTEQNLAYNQNFLDAFPGSKFKVLQTIAQGDYVVNNWTISGKHTGPLHSPSGAVIPPTGKMATVTGSTTTQLKDGKIVHAWTWFDMAGLLGQLGLLPPM